MTSEPFRADKDTVISLVVHLVPNYLEVLKECDDQATWQKLSERFAEISARLKVKNYVLLYEDERRIQAAALNAIMSPEEQAEFAKFMEESTPKELQSMLKEIAEPDGLGEQIANGLFPDDPADHQAQLESFQKLPIDEQQESVKRTQFLMGFVIAWLHEAIAVMVHGEKMTSLVPKAMAGDTEAFAKAVHIDKNLLFNHPWFHKTYLEAIHDPDKHRELLGKISRRLASHVTKGRQKLPGVFFIFALLESMRWLNDIRHGEILAICDAAKFDRLEHHIADENAITKALGRYRRYQKTGGLSMH